VLFEPTRANLAMCRPSPHFTSFRLNAWPTSLPRRRRLRAASFGDTFWNVLRGSGRELETFAW